MKLYYSPVSTYSQKALIAFYEKGVSFEKEIVNLKDPQANAKYREVYPIGKIPLAMPEENHLLPESSIIIEYLEQHFKQGAQLISDDPEISRKTRFMDRMNDLYLNNPVVTLLFSANRSEQDINNAKHYLDCTYGYLDACLEKNTWLMGDEFTMADCSCIPPLFYAQKVYPFSKFQNITAYFERAMQRPSYQAVLEEAMPILQQMENA